MNLRNKKLVLVIRILAGLFFIFSGIGGLMSGQSLKGVPEPMVPVMTVLWQVGILQMIKTTEIISGLMLVFGFLPQLAAIFLAPICIGVIVFNSHIALQYVLTGIIISIIDIYFGYVYWDKYKALFIK